jgi:hypothetical protein
VFGDDGVTMTARFWLLGALGVTVSLLGATACSSSSGSSPPNTPVGVVADSGFRPPANGFSFQNYGGELSDGAVPVNLTAADVEKMFGEGVCVDAKLRRCDLIPEAQAWLNDTNQTISGGHCYGFSVLAELLWLGQENPSVFGATKTTALEVDSNATLQSQIAYDWALQLLTSVQDQRVNGTPNQILTKLIEVLKPHPSQTYTAVIWKGNGSGGHAVTPYEVVNQGGGMYKVMIYDNNWPDQTRAISFNTKADTWTYDAASNPDQPDSVYEGDAKSETISLYPTSPGLGTQPCPFCAKEPAKGTSKAGDNTEEITLTGDSTEHATLIVTDDAGRKLGYINGNLVNQIPGARVDQTISDDDWTDNIAPDFFLPADVKYTITIDGTGLSSPDNETLAITGPSYDLSVGPIPMRPGDKNTLVIEPDATELSYTSSRKEAPAMTLGVSDNRADYSFQVSGVSDQPGSTLNLGLPPEGGNLNLQYVGATTTSSVNLKLTRSSEQGVQVFDHNAIPLVGGDSAQLQFGNWTNTSQGIPLVVTKGGVQSTQTLTDQQPG